MEEPNSQPRSLAEAFADVNGQAGPLSSRLAAYRSASSQLRPDIAKAYDQLVERLDVLDRGRVGPQVGEAMSSFSLPDERGRLVLLSKFLESGPVVISINRGHWCPYCKLELRSLAGINADIERLGARVVSIMPDSARFTSDYAAANVLPFPVLSDMDLAYSLSAVLPSRTSRIVSEFGVTAPRWSATAAETRRRQCVKITSAADQSGRARDWPMPMPAAAPSLDFVLVREPLMLTRMELGYVYFVFLPSILTTPFAGRAVARYGTRPVMWGSSLVACFGRACCC